MFARSPSLHLKRRRRRGSDMITDASRLALMRNSLKSSNSIIFRLLPRVSNVRVGPPRGAHAQHAQLLLATNVLCQHKIVMAPHEAKMETSRVCLRIDLQPIGDHDDDDCRDANERSAHPSSYFDKFASSSAGVETLNANGKRNKKSTKCLRLERDKRERRATSPPAVSAAA